jgi:glucose/mannose-6-phosphate isomerase
VAKAELLDNEESIGRLDPGGMLKVVGRMPGMIAEAEKLSSYVSLPAAKPYDQVLVLGMGGSAIAGDIAADLYFNRSVAPIITSRNYSLPDFAGEETLVFALSYSGNTEETLAAVKEAERRRAQIVCVTSGGKLKELADSRRWPLFLIPGGLQPRAALPYLLLPLLTGLDRFKIASLNHDEIKEAAALLARLKDEYGPARPARSNPVKQLAKKTAGRIPVIFGSSATTGAAALRFKTQLNENSKVTALLSLFPELDHNEIVNLSVLKREAHNFSLFIFRDEDDNERIKKRIEITKSLLVRQLGGVTEVVSEGKSRLARLFSLIFFGDYLSVYLALASEIDPTPVEAISRLKKELAR